MRQLIGAVTLLLAVATMAFAHGGEQHVMGTVTAISDQSITIKSKDGKTTEVVLTSQTKFMKGGAASTAKDVKSGDRVAIHARKNGDKLEAATVSVGVAKAKAHGDMDNMKDMDGSSGKK